MAAPQPLSTDTSKPRLPLGGYLFTPPENTVDSFNSYQSDEPENEHYTEQWRKAVQASQNTVLPPLARTPPASPPQTALPSITSAAGYSVHDVPLFPRQPSTDLAQSQQPLFEPSSSPAPIQTTEQPKPLHTLEQPPNNPQPRHKIFPWSLALKTDEEKLEYFRKVNGEALRMGRQLPEPRKSSVSSQRTPEDARQLDSLTRSLTRPAGVTKSRSAPRTASKPKAPIATSPANSAPRKSRASKARATPTFEDAWPQAREKTNKNTRAPATKKVDDVAWSELPDYAPPVSDLDTNSKQLKIVWKNKPKPLEDTPAVAMLHEQEVALAEELCLASADKYLANKRRIFQARVQYLKDGKNFTKTAAQVACSVDVNKASQLFQAFDKVGWFEPHWFNKYV